MAPKKWYQRIQVSDLPLLPALIAGAIRLLFKTCRFTIVGKEHLREGLNLGLPGLCTTWHFAFPAMVYFFRNLNAVLMVSRSRDGELVTRILGHLGYQVARGSPGKGGAQALRTMLSYLARGHHAGLIADGSQGPACVAQKGILLLARHSQGPLLPVSMAAHPCWRFGSWDRTVLPKPFSHIVIALGPLIWVERNASSEELESVRRRLEESLNQLTATARGRLQG
jgi:lysophospholipid acyltransferase (LPLAT)-like uncharacterized protein